METQAIDDQDHLVNYDNDNENDDLGYRLEEYFDKADEADEEDENNHSNRNVVDSKNILDRVSDQSVDYNHYVLGFTMLLVLYYRNVAKHDKPVITSLLHYRILQVTYQELRLSWPQAGFPIFTGVSITQRLDLALLVLVIGGWSRLPPIEYNNLGLLAFQSLVGNSSLITFCSQSYLKDAIANYGVSG
ncbi:hypothetical protein Tco_1314375 [Tanacetum coccineum]